MYSDFYFSDYIESDWWFDDLPMIDGENMPEALEDLCLDILKVSTDHPDKALILNKASEMDVTKYINSRLKQLIDEIVNSDLMKSVSYCKAMQKKITNFDDLLFSIIHSGLGSAESGYYSESEKFIKEESDRIKARDFVNRSQASHLQRVFQEIVMHAIMRLPYDILHSAGEHVAYYKEYEECKEDPDFVEDESFILGQKLVEKIPTEFPKDFLEYGASLVSADSDCFVESVYDDILKSDYEYFHGNSN